MHSTSPASGLCELPMRYLPAVDRDATAKHSKLQLDCKPSESWDKNILIKEIKLNFGGQSQGYLKTSRIKIGAPRLNTRKCLIV